MKIFQRAISTCFFFPALAAVAQVAPPFNETELASDWQPLDSVHHNVQYQGSPNYKRLGGKLAEWPQMQIGKDTYKLLRYESILSELDVTGYQRDQIAELFKQQFQRRRGFLREHSQFENQQLESINSEYGMAAIASQSAEFQGEFEALLRPSQMRRLEQVALEMRVRSEGVLAVILDPEVAAVLEISLDQREALLERAESLSKEYEEEVLKLKSEMRARLTLLLLGQQRIQLRDMLGDNLSWEITQ